MFGYYGMFFDPTFIILVPALIVSAWAQFKVSSTFNEYERIDSFNRYSGYNVARMLLDDAGLYDVQIETVRGKLSDHYDPTKRILRLSSGIYNGTSVAALGVAAHEVGHAIQHKEKYSALIFRNSIAPAVNFASSMSWLLFIAGIILNFSGLTTVGILLFSAVVVFQLVTLPVEFNASSRALKLLEQRGILYGNEVNGAKKVLNAAALTYVAATLMAVSQLLRLIVLSDRNSNN
ncbi:MAG: zinc metallopeptidase [Sarcina ventriculi]|nr:zinc metallopeptidase [Sarcina ventriculi]MDY7063179.1 zinc metallopeptidase [Sarcina ventriculi]